MQPHLLECLRLILNSHSPMNDFVPPQTISLGSLTIYWYGIMITLAIFVGYFLSLRRAGNYDIEKHHIENVFLLSIPLGLVGARLYHVLIEWEYYFRNPEQIPNVMAGGLAIHGAILLGLLGIYLYARWYGLKFWHLLDLFAPVVALGQAIGRWGNYFNQELYGRPTDLPWKIFIAPENRLPEYFLSAYYHPTFLYESLLNLVNAGLLFYLARRWGKASAGKLAAVYLMMYGAIRFITESVRIDEVAVLGPLKWAQIVSLLILLAGGILFYLRNRQKPLASKPFQGNQTNSDPAQKS